MQTKKTIREVQTIHLEMRDGVTALQQVRERETGARHTMRETDKKRYKKSYNTRNIQEIQKIQENTKNSSA